MGSPYYIPMYAMKVKKPDLDISPMAEGFEALRKRQDELAVGSLMSGNDLKGASQRAYRGGDLRTGNDLRRLQHTEEDRAAAASNRQTAAADREAKAKADGDAKARAYVSNMMSTLDPDSPTFADDWKHHVGRLRSAGYQVGPEYDDPRTGYQMVLGEVSSFKDRSTQQNQRRDDDLRRQELDIRRQETDSKSLSRNRNDALRAIKLMRESETPEQWEQNSGVINAVFGRPVPFNERNVVLAQAESATSEPEKSPIDKDIEFQTRMKQAYGEPKRGYIWAQGPDGKVTQQLVAQATKPIDPGMQNAVRSLTSRLDSAEQTLLNGTMLGNYAGEKGGIGDAGRAYEDYESAALGIVYAMSGKQTTNKEMERFLSINKPQWNDTESTIQVRTSRVKGLLDAIYGKMEQGMDYDEAERQALVESAGSRPSKQSAPGGWSAKRLD